MQLLLRHAILRVPLHVQPGRSRGSLQHPQRRRRCLESRARRCQRNGLSDTINLAAGGTYTLTTIDNSANGANGLPVIINDAAGLDLTINGNGATIQRNAEPGAPEFRILQIGNGAEANCNGLTIRSGKVVNGVFQQTPAQPFLFRRRR